MRAASALALLASFAPATLSLSGAWPGRLAGLTPPLAFLATLALFPRVRPRRPVLVSPRSVLLAGFAIQLVVAPAFFLLDGPVRWVFPVEQTWGALGEAAVLIGLSFPCWAVGVTLVGERDRAVSAPSGWGRAPVRLIVAFAALGVAGLGLLALQAGEGTLPGAGGATDGGGAVAVLRLLLRPFLAVAGVAVLSNALLDGRRSLVLPGLACLGAILVAFGSVDARRAPVLAALIGLLAAFSLLRGRPGPRQLAALAVLGAGAFLAVRVLRSPGVPFSRLFDASGTDSSVLGAINTELQSYAGGLQMVGFLIDNVAATGGWLHGLGQVYGAVAPLPVIGGPVRDATPIAVYNTLFLNRTDQVLPLAGQLYLDFGVVSLAAGFVVLGAVTEVLQRWFERSRTLLEAFVWATPCAWLAFALGSGPAGFYQSVIYFSLPFYALLVLVALRRRPSRWRSPAARSAG